MYMTSVMEGAKEPTIVCRNNAQPALLVRLRLPLSQVAVSLGSALERMVDQLRREGLAPTGAPFLAFHELSQESAQVELGIPVAVSAQGNGGARPGNIPAGRYLTFAHMKLDQPLLAEFRAMQAWLRTHHERTTGPLYAVIHNEQPHFLPQSVILLQRRISAGSSTVLGHEGSAGGLSDQVWEQIGAAILALVQLNARTAALTSRFDESHPELQPKRPMRVKEAMTPRVFACRPLDSGQRAAQLMWEHDIGALPVVDDAGRPIGMVTDRDLCMAAFTQGKTLKEIEVKSAMSNHVHVCAPDDALRDAEHKMAIHQIRRLPVVEAHGLLIGMLSVNDLALASAPTPSDGHAAEVASTLAAISQHRKLHRSQVMGRFS